jgi:glutathione synthase/RimK-type ligase-like ATP-grasp enzyme
LTGACALTWHAIGWFGAVVLEELGLPSPPTVIARDERTLREAAHTLPVYVKVAFGTASHGLFRVRTSYELERAIERVRTQLADGVVVQKAVEGRLQWMQAVSTEGGWSVSTLTVRQ